MIEIEDYIRKLHERTGVKLKEDDPILIELIAQQVILEEFSTEIELIIENYLSKQLNGLKIDNKNKKKALYDLSNEIKNKLHNQRIYFNKQNQILKKNYLRLISLNISIQILIIILI